MFFSWLFKPPGTGKDLKVVALMELEVNTWNESCSKRSLLGGLLSFESSKQLTSASKWKALVYLRLLDSFDLSFQLERKFCFLEILGWNPRQLSWIVARARNWKSSPELMDDRRELIKFCFVGTGGLELLNRPGEDCYLAKNCFPFSGKWSTHYCCLVVCIHP